MAYSSLLLIAIIIVTRNKIIVILSCLFLVGLTVFLFSGTRALSHDIGRIIKNTGPKSTETIYSVLFGTPPIDWCIWMEIKLCPKELERILQIKTFEVSSYTASDSLNFTNSFSEKPAWWKEIKTTYKQYFQV